MLDAAELPRARQKEYARLVIEETDRMGAMIDEILEFARGGPARLRISPVSLEALCERVHRLLEPDLKARGMSFRSELGYKGGTPGHALSVHARPHAWGTAVNIYRIGDTMLDNQDAVRNQDLVAGQGGVLFGNGLQFIQPRRAFLGARLRF